jgi:response regulator RpfG family c-di-GMP phosphodiesterase
VPLISIDHQVLGVLQVINARNPGGAIVPFSARDETMMLLFASIAAVAVERAQLTRSILLRMIRMAQMRDPRETGEHANRVGSYAVEIYDGWAIRHGLPAELAEKERDLLRMAAMLHDVGKVAVSDLILKKEGRLGEAEYEAMKCHTVMGARLFGDGSSEMERVAAMVALDHHERWDGGGYPGHVDVATGTPLADRLRPDGRARGKGAAEIHLFGRIVAIADVYDALSSPRQYKESWPEAAVLQYLREGAGKHFDPELVEIFLGNIDMMRAIQKRYTDK